MALINCPECDIEVSDKADTCPKCGYGIVKHFEEIAKQEIEEQARLDREKREIERNELAKINYQKKLAQVQMPEKPIVVILIFQIMGILLLWYIIGLGMFGDGVDGFQVFMFLIQSALIIIWILYLIGRFKEKIETYKLAQDDFESYRAIKVGNDEVEQNRKQAAYNRQLQEKMSKMVKCPSCSSSNTKPISTTSRVVSVGMVGLASSKIGKTMECKNCGYKW